MEELINNIMQSPENTNPNILRDWLQKLCDQSSGDSDDYIDADKVSY